MTIEITAGDNRFRDSGESIYDFADEFLVACPRCRSMARVVPAENETPKLFSPRRLICLKCPHRDIFEGQSIGIGEPVDWYFRLPLWLQISCCGTTLWAYNLKQLEFIEKYVGAKLRERTPNATRSMISRLPGWMK